MSRKEVQGFIAGLLMEARNPRPRSILAKKLKPLDTTSHLQDAGHRKPY